MGSGNRYRFGTKDAVEEYCALDVRKLNREGIDRKSTRLNSSH